MLQDSLGFSVNRDHIDDTTKREILNSFWDLNIQAGNIDNGDILDVYFLYYIQECRTALHDGGRHIWAMTHSDVVEVAKYLKNSFTRNEIKEFLRTKLPPPKPINEEEMLDSSIDLVARLLLMMEFGCLQYGFSGLRELAWTQDSLVGFVNDYFSTPPILLKENVKLENLFTAQNLGRIAGIEIEWTNNLADHLLLIDDDKKVSIFHHASFLQFQQSSPIFPPGLIKETLQTLALLFPQSDKNIKEWFKKQASIRKLDSKVIKCGRLKTEDRQIEKFKFWHDRLVILKQSFDEAEPSTISQWWFDRRKRVQWYTFWVAALVLTLTIFFGLVQSVEGALQVYKSFNPSS